MWIEAKFQFADDVKSEKVEEKEDADPIDDDKVAEIQDEVFQGADEALNSLCESY